MDKNIIGGFLFCPRQEPRATTRVGAVRVSRKGYLSVGFTCCAPRSCCIVAVRHGFVFVRLARHSPPLHYVEVPQSSCVKGSHSVSQAPHYNVVYRASADALFKC